MPVWATKLSYKEPLLLNFSNLRLSTLCK